MEGGGSLKREYPSHVTISRQRVEVTINKRGVPLNSSPLVAHLLHSTTTSPYSVEPSPDVFLRQKRLHQPLAKGMVIGSHWAHQLHGHLAQR